LEENQGWEKHGKTWENMGKHGKTHIKTQYMEISHSHGGSPLSLDGFCYGKCHL
jgi:hypothetical protein